jgi:hypothetical protein
MAGCAVGSLSGLFYLVFITVPATLVSGALDHLPQGLNWALRAVSLHVGSHPFLIALLFGLILMPGFLRPISAERYFVSISVVTLALGAFCFFIVEQPTRRLGEVIHEALSQERKLPDPLSPSP